MSVTFSADQKGSTSTLFALSLVPALGIAGLAVDYNHITMKRQAIQGAADAAVLTGAALHGQPESEQIALTSKAFDANVAATALNTRVTSSVLIAPGQVRINASADVPTFLLHLLSGDLSSTKIAVTAVALSQSNRDSGPEAVCILALGKTEGSGLVMGTRSGIDANCRAFVNSGGPRAIKIGSGLLKTTATSIVGSWETSPGFTYSPTPQKASAALTDPLAGLVAPAAGACLHTDLEVRDSGNLTLDPGVYCGGLNISATRQVTLRPGVYVIRDGAFRAGSSANITGEGVLIHLTGRNAVIDWGSGAKINFKAQASGVYKGIVLWSAGRQPGPNVLGSSSDSILQGVVYSPDNEVIIGCSGTVGSLADWTLWVVKSLEIGSGATLNIRTGYESSTTPVPDRVAGALLGWKVRLAQ
jgi:Flp pilus assembly protein TadG